MRTRRRSHRRRIAAAVVAALVIPVSGPAAALAVPADPQYLRPVTESTPLDPPLPAPTVRDTKLDSPGASRAPQYDEPRTIQILRPERTIVRDTDPVLPIALAGAALLVALSLAGIELVRARSLRPS
jgi:hypothetical protein